jgi:aspartyl-tRNA(Asn)/glutamyl-tRNA(Gln) amidotransferase subunit B
MKFYKPLIGLEIHVELSTSAKMFCQCDANWQKYAENTNTCPVCLGLPGALPVPNKKAVEYTIKIAQAFGCDINKKSHFDRKHYFYPDLPKGYQISQYDEPIGINGKLSSFIKDDKNNYHESSFRIHRVHLEEDTGKLKHQGNDSVVDFNRSGVPLVEIVTEADFESSEQVKTFLQEIHTVINYLQVSNADMEKGGMRLEPNISIREYEGETEPVDWNSLPFPKYKVEVKNINSFNFVKKAVEYEIERQKKLLESKILPPQETRGWDEVKNATFSQRSKEEAHDYRYFPEPDIPPMIFSDEYLECIRATIPPLSFDLVKSFTAKYGVRLTDALQIAKNVDIAGYFDQCCQIIIKSHGQNALCQKIANTMINKGFDPNTPPEKLVSKLIASYSPKQTDLGILSSAIQKILGSNPKSIQDFKSGKKNALMYLVGQVMRELRGSADPKIVAEELEKSLNNVVS